MRVGRVSRSTRIAAMSAALVVGLVVVVGQATSFWTAAVSPDDRSGAAHEWCTSAGTSGPSGQVRQLAVVELGMKAYSEHDPAEKADPLWAPACAIAYELWGLTTDEWNWCSNEEVRSSVLAAAITLLGMGEEEASGTESFGEAPGDNPAEYTQACRFAYRFWRDSRAGADPGPPARAHFAVDPARSAWCAANPGAIREARDWLGIVDDGGGEDSLEDLVGETRACNFASLLAEGRAVSASEPERLQ